MIWYFARTSHDWRRLKTPFVLNNDKNKSGRGRISSIYNEDFLIFVRLLFSAFFGQGSCRVALISIGCWKVGAFAHVHVYGHLSKEYRNSTRTGQRILHQLVRSKFSNTRCLFGWFFFNLFSSQVVTTGTNSYLMRKARITVYKVTLQVKLLSCQSSCIVIVPSQPANHVRLRMTVPAY